MRPCSSRNGWTVTPSELERLGRRSHEFQLWTRMQVSSVVLVERV